jgi:cytochrome c-type biogenesis protein CcmH
MVWAIFAVLTAFAALAILVPLARGRSAAPAAPTDAGVPIYADQLAEIDRDLARGAIGAREAEAARAEIGRRLLRAAHAAPAAAASDPRRRRVVALIALVLLPAAAVALYAALGTPDLPDAPLAARLAGPTEGQSLDTLIARVEQHLARNPEDGQGWAVLAPVYLKAGRAADAAAAYQNAIRILGSDADRQAGLGEALTALADGIVTADARAAFERAAALDATAIRPKLYLALALGQEGRKDEAVAAWRAILAGAKGDEPWLPAARAELAKLGVEPPPPPPGTPPAAGPGAAEAIAAMPPAERAQVIEGMVAQLAGRLDADGGSIDEWLRLVRAYAVLGRADEAKEAAGKARQAFAADAAAQKRIDAAAAELGLSLN